MILQSLKMAWKSIISNKMRSFLTMLGIIIGVMSLVVLVSLASGTTDSVKNEISSIGTNLLTVYVSDDKGSPIKLDDLNSLAKDDAIKDISPMAQTTVTAGSKFSERTASIYGINGAYQRLQGLSVKSGRFIKNVDVDNHTNVIVTSSDLARDLIGREDAVGQNIRLNGITYLIIGILETSSASTSTYSDYTAYIPYTSLIRLSNTITMNITSFCASAMSDTSLDTAEAALNSYLLTRFNNDEHAYYIENQSKVMKAMQNISNTFALMLGGIAAISLLVGGIGIMNIMLVSVTERTREIGIRKAIGAGRGAIMLQFLIEALMISLIGCGIGIFLSWAALRILAVAAAGSQISFAMSMRVVWIAIAFSLAIGVIFGLYPANKASGKNPIEALRYTD